MKTDKGTLKKTKTGYLVTLPTKKGQADFQIPDSAQRFNTADAADQLEVDVERDDQNRILKVTIPGKAEYTKPAPPPKAGYGKPSGPRPSGPRNPPPRPPQNPGASESTAVRGKRKASPKVLGMPFHNPFTFLSFPEKSPVRREPTPLSADEPAGETARSEPRYTGVLELEVTTRSPLLSCHSTPVSDEKGHKTFEVLRIANDVIVPSTGVRGSLRTLLTVLTGGTLGYLNSHAFLCQGRDAQLGPRGLTSPEHTPGKAFLAEVLEAGTEFRDGRIRLGETRLIRLEALEAVWSQRHGRAPLPRGPQAPVLWVGLDSRDELTGLSDRRTPETPWRVKLSGRPVNSKGKREGLFLAGSQMLDLPAELWADYSGRHVHGDRPDLRKGDLIWLEPRDPNATRIDRADDVRTIQWSRWGRRGRSLRKLVEDEHRHVLPDYLQGDGLVDEVTDLFGQVAPERGLDRAPAFAARIRPENLVFFDAVGRVERRVPLAPLAPPHPGCVAFYCENDNPDDVSEKDSLRGYKVYRTTNERGATAPWRFESQGVYNEHGKLLGPQQRVNKTVDLVPEGLAGSLRIAFRGLTERELALLLLACSVPWRLGGGKPLGLGLCMVRVRSLLDELGEPLLVPGWKRSTDETGDLLLDGWRPLVADLADRVRLWEASQVPVAFLRYPRAVDLNRHRFTRGGHAWFQRHALPRIVPEKGRETREPGLKPLYIDGDLKVRATQGNEPLEPGLPLVSGQLLPPFDPDHPASDVLYGYDGFGSQVEDRERPTRRVFLKLEPFDPQVHKSDTAQSSGSHGKNAEFRRTQRDGRSGG